MDTKCVRAFGHDGEHAYIIPTVHTPFMPKADAAPATDTALSTMKLDTGKPPAFRGLAEYFPLALLEVAGVSAFGHVKYKEWGGWVKVENASGRYADALMRHTLQRAAGQEFDEESKLRHAAQAAWNALAVLELELREAEKPK